jgi:hypothetical protein
VVLKVHVSQAEKSPMRKPTGQVRWKFDNRNINPRFPDEDLPPTEQFKWRPNREVRNVQWQSVVVSLG